MRSGCNAGVDTFTTKTRRSAKKNKLNAYVIFVKAIRAVGWAAKPNAVLRNVGHCSIQPNYSLHAVVLANALGIDAASAPKKFLHLIHPAFCSRVLPIRISLADSVEFLEQFLLTIIKFHGRLNDDVTHQITM